MSRYIDADALLDKAYDGLQEGEVLYRISPSLVDSMPTADVAPVVHGHWEWFEEWSESNTEHFSECEDAGWRCSNCKVPLEESAGCLWDDMGNKPRVKHCPNCGAKMDEVEE